MDDLLNQLVGRLQKAFTDRLVSVILYGSAAAGDHQSQFSDLNILCVLREVTVRELEQSESIFRWWRERHNPSPLLLSEHEVRTSTDCFAIEFHDMVNRRRVLHGADVIEGLAVDYAFYRAQVERELRAKQLRLRQKAAGMLSEKDLLRRLLADSISTFCVLFRHALILSGASGEMKKREVIVRTGEAFGIRTQPFETLLDVREGGVKPRDFEPAQLLEEYLKEISVVIEKVDRLEK